MPTAAGRNGVGRLVPPRSPDTHTREIPQALEGSDSIMPVSLSREEMSSRPSCSGFRVLGGRDLVFHEWLFL